MLKPAANQNGPTPTPSSTPTGPSNSAGGESIALESKGYLTPVQLILVSPKVGGEIVKLKSKKAAVSRKTTSSPSSNRSSSNPITIMPWPFTRPPSIAGNNFGSTARRSTPGEGGTG